MIRALAACAALLTAGSAASAETGCGNETIVGVPYTICIFDRQSVDVRLFLRDGDGLPYGGFTRLIGALEAQGKSLTFAMNGGMYHRDKSPVGLYVEEGRQESRLVTRGGPGNFHLLPNGVFYLTQEGAGVEESLAFDQSGRRPHFATQSGPMLVIEGALHPRFLKNSDSRKYRNGVGVRADGKTLVFAISNAPVNFWTFGSVFLDHLQTPNALYLDGTISSIHAPGIKRSDRLFPMGPIIGVVE